MGSELEWAQLQDFIKLKKESPEEYKILLEDMVGIIKDLQEVTKKALGDF